MPGDGQGVYNPFDIAPHAADFGLHNFIVRKTITEIVNNSSVLQNDDELLLALAANEVWIVNFYLLIDSAGTPDFKFAFTMPAGGEAFALHTSRGNAVASFATGGFGVGSTDGSDQMSTVVAVLARNGANAGNLQLQWAQNVANPTDTSVFLNSCLIATQIL